MKKNKIETFFEAVEETLENIEESLDDLKKETAIHLEKAQRLSAYKAIRREQKQQRIEYNAKKYNELLKELITLELYIKLGVQESIQSQLTAIGKRDKASSFIENFSYESEYEAIDMIKQFYESILNLPLDHETRQ